MLRIAVLVHAVTIVFVGVLAQYFEAAVEVLEDKTGVMNAVEGGGLDRCVVYHILEDNLIADSEGAGKKPGAHEITTEAGVAAEAIKTHLRPLP